jgi:ferritin-like metal-binding protein YciE
VFKIFYRIIYLNKGIMKNRDVTANNLRELFADLLENILWVERALFRSLPEVNEKVDSSDLLDILTEHLEATLQQITRLENVFEIVGIPTNTETCAMKALIEETEDVLDMFDIGPVCDAGLIVSIQKIKHYEIAAYDSLRSFANTLGEYEAASLLEETLEEEKEFSQRLTDLTEGIIAINVIEKDNS